MVNKSYVGPLLNKNPLPAQRRGTLSHTEISVTFTQGTLCPALGQKRRMTGGSLSSAPNSFYPKVIYFGIAYTDPRQEERKQS